MIGLELQYLLIPNTIYYYLGFLLAYTQATLQLPLNSVDGTYHSML